MKFSEVSRSFPLLPLPMNARDGHSRWHGLRLSAAALAAVSITACGAFAASAITEPVGVTRQTISPGLQTVGLTLNNPVVFSGVIVSNTDGAPPHVVFDTSADVGALLDPTKSYYLEVVDGTATTFVGDRVDVDVTLTQAAADDTVVLKTAAHNTLSFPLGSNVLAEYRVVLKQHLTIGQVFGTKGNTPFSGSTSFAAADQVIVYDPATGGYISYFLARTPTGSVEEWRLVGSSLNRDQTLIPPATGLFFRRNGSSGVSLVHAGNVRANAFAMPLQAGYNFITLPFPTNESPESMLMSADNGFVGSSNFSAADQILLFNGTGFETYFYARTPTGSVDQWRKVGSNVNYSTIELLSYGSSFFFKKVSAEHGYVVPQNFSL